MNGSRAKRDMAALIARYGGTVVALTQKKHLKFTARFGERTLSIVSPVSPTNETWLWNAEAWLKRTLKRDDGSPSCPSKRSTGR